VKKFDELGRVVKRDAYGLGETFDKNFKCRDRYHTCCRTAFCNKQTTSPCPPPGKFFFYDHIVFKEKKILFCFIAKATPKKEVKACYQCKGADACKPEKLQGSEIRTSGAFGGKNLYCYTVCREKYIHFYFFIFFYY
jgi:hypothetical protein